jgi:transposase
MLKNCMTSQEEHYEQLLGLSGAWKVSAVMLDLAVKKVTVEIGYDLSQSMECGTSCTHYDHREMREWRHLDTMQFETILRCELPRCNCPEHGVKTLRVLWAGKGSRFTLLFESFAIEVLQACSSVKAAVELASGQRDQAPGGGEGVGAQRFRADQTLGH